MKILALALLLGAAAPAEATVYDFTQGGYADGATAYGSFTASDLDLDGQINSFAGEVTDFTFNFSGSATVAAFTLSYADLTSVPGFTGLVYDLDGVLGDGADEGVLAAGPNGAFVVAALAPPCDGVAVCSVAQDSFDNDDPSTGALIIAAVPEPAIWAMMVIGFALVGTALRRRPAFVFA